FGVMDLAWGGGAMVFGFSFPLWTRRFGVPRSFAFFAVVITGLAAFGTSYSTHLLHAVIGFALMGGAANTLGIVVNTTLQRDVSNEVMGRVLSSVQICQYIFVPIVVWGLGKYSELPRGLMIHENPLRDGFVAMGLFFFFVAIQAIFISWYFHRHYEPVAGKSS
ncbi:MAG: hypothetical protein AAF492_25545, partial [Verrucomicrobiota bacterium]